MQGHQGWSEMRNPTTASIK